MLARIGYAAAAYGMFVLVLATLVCCARRGEELPGDFPPGLTTYPGSEITNHIRLGPPHYIGSRVALVTPASLRDVSIFYFEQTQSIGLEVIADFDLMRMFDYYFGNDDYIVNIRASLEENGSVYVYLTCCRAYECPYDTSGFHFWDIFMTPAGTREIHHMRMGNTHLMFLKSANDYDEVFSDLSGWWRRGGWERFGDDATEYRGYTLRIAHFSRSEDTITCYIGDSLEGDTACLVELFRGSEIR